jgi:hypothetical protein
MFGRPATTLPAIQRYWRPPLPYVDAEQDQALRINHAQLFQLQNRAPAAQPANQPLLLFQTPRPWSHNEDKWLLAYGVAEAYSQQGQASANPVQIFLNFTTSRPQAFEEQPDIRHADHSLLHQ